MLLVERYLERRIARLERILEQQERETNKKFNRTDELFGLFDPKKKQLKIMTEILEKLFKYSTILSKNYSYNLKDPTKFINTKDECNVTITATSGYPYDLASRINVFLNDNKTLGFKVSHLDVQRFDVKALARAAQAIDADIRKLIT